MLKKKKNKRSLKLIGKRKYDFDITLEKQIYSCLCCSYGAKKAFKKLDVKLKFNSYHEWKQYICDKYKYYCKDDLIEFSRYLNQNIRDAKPFYEFWDLFIPFILTFLAGYGTDKFLGLKFDFLEWSIFPIFSAIIILLLLVIIFVLPLLLLIRQIIIPIFDNNIEENFFKDYKEIIDDMIRK